MQTITRPSGHEIPMNTGDQLWNEFGDVAVELLEDGRFAAVVRFPNNDRPFRFDSPTFATADEAFAFGDAELVEVT